VVALPLATCERERGQAMPRRTADGRLPSVAAVVVNWNRREDTLACLASLAGTSYAQRAADAWQVILVDNGSSDGTAEAARTGFPLVDVIALSENRGFAAGCNVGLRRALDAGVDYVLLANNDTVVAPDMVAQLVTVAERERDAGLLTPVIFYHDQPTRVWSAGYRERGVTLSAQPPIGQASERAPYPVDRVYGCGVLIRQSVLEEVGLFDERFFMYYEDADLCRRVQGAGYRLLVVPAARMWHKVSASTGEGSPLQKYYLARSGVLFFAKHTPWFLAPVIVAYRLGVALKQLVLAGRRWRWDVAAAYVRGLYDGLRMLVGRPVAWHG
jgi:GT2 family glycosyltransferase